MRQLRCRCTFLRIELLFDNQHVRNRQDPHCRTEDKQQDQQPDRKSAHRIVLTAPREMERGEADHNEARGEKDRNNSLTEPEALPKRMRMLLGGIIRLVKEDRCVRCRDDHRIIIVDSGVAGINRPLRGS